MAKSINLNICHLYPDLMDTYGDKGNIIALTKRCAWRDIKVSVKNISIGDSFSASDFNFFFFGGGQDRQQEIVGADLQKRSAVLKQAVENGAVMLSICGGYQLLQKYFLTKEGKIIPGIGIFNAHTEASETRMIQNLLIELSPAIISDMRMMQNPKYKIPNTSLIGFENHSGKTYLQGDTEPLGKVIKGSGNNGQDKTEGAVYKNAFGCYMHGSLLPKNPHFSDYLISKALGVNLSVLDDSIEWHAHNQALMQTRPG